MDSSIPHDPDFDTQQLGEVWYETPLGIFTVGVVAAILLLCTIGFFILLFILW